ncbi:MAG: hypothetical protein AAEJ52_06300 [Myxococcota bacterium]
MILHLLSTTVMVRLGYVDGNLMSHVVPACAKLQERAVRILSARSGLSDEQARVQLERSGGSVAVALRDLESAAEGD